MTTQATPIPTSPYPPAASWVAPIPSAPVAPAPPSCLSPSDRRLLSALYHADTDLPAAAAAAGLDLADLLAWLAEPRIQQHLAPLQALRALRREAFLDAALRDAVEGLRPNLKSSDLVERRRAATAILRAVALATRSARPPRPASPAPASEPTSPPRQPRPKAPSPPPPPSVLKRPAPVPSPTPPLHLSFASSLPPIPSLLERAGAPAGSPHRSPRRGPTRTPPVLDST